MEGKLADTSLEDEIELIDILRVIWSRRKLIIFGTLLSMILAGGVSTLLPKQYEATTQIQIGSVWEEELESPYLTRELVTSNDFLSQLITQLNLGYSPQEMKKRKMINTEVVEGGSAGKKLPLLLFVRVKANSPQNAVRIADKVGAFVVESHLGRFQEKLREYKTYEEELSQEVGRIESAMEQLESFINQQQMGPAVNAPSVILLQAQLADKNVQLLKFKKELLTTRINNNSSTLTENTKIIGHPVLPKKHVSPRIVLNIVIAGVIGFFASLVLAFFLEYLHRVRLQRNNT